jgi:hypothetical protein
MRHLPLWLIAIAFTPAAWPQAVQDAPQPSSAGGGSWSRVENLYRGDQIMVARPGGGFPVPCRFSGATDEMLFCDSLYRDGEFQFRREDIENLRRDDKRRNIRIAVIALGGGGLIWGLAKPPGPGVPRALDGLAGAAAGALAGCLVGLPVALFTPGRLIYRHARADHGTQTAPAKTGESR